MQGTSAISSTPFGKRAVFIFACINGYFNNRGYYYFIIHFSIYFNPSKICPILQLPDKCYDAKNKN